MEKNMETYIRRLIELDSKAVSMKEKLDAELIEIETRGRDELRKIDAALEKTADKARHRYSEIVEDARLQAKEIERAADLKAGELQAGFLKIREDAAKAVWKQLLEIER